MGFRHPDFASKANPETLIIYGLVGDPGRVLAELETTEGNIPPLTNRYALICPSTGDIRLSSRGWMNLSLNQRLRLETNDDLFLFCSERLLQNTPPFSGPARLFLKAYLDFVRSAVAANRDELEPVKPETEIFTYRDFVFSAWLPFPEARILLPPRYGDGDPAFAELNIAFRLHGRIIAVVIDGAETPLRSRQRKVDYLHENHPRLDLVHVQLEQLRSGEFPRQEFPDSFVRFWQGVDLPIGPCPPVIEIIDGDGNAVTD